LEWEYFEVFFFFNSIYESEVLSGIYSTKLEISYSFSGPLFDLLGDYKGFPESKNVVPLPEIISIDSLR
jgi:hypothetical protein